eukprot:TRINITY_DN11174_c0_g1_i4.p1 TRINITY_DN11174_c0_g1~~TRINITY_DN11174_c0_g1_i4.p1  ORF type:complete len:112 (+),score=8.16 TRINITY_DN11174_c0_g1_i4:938-1273(+)
MFLPTFSQENIKTKSWEPVINMYTSFYCTYGRVGVAPHPTHMRVGTGSRPSEEWILLNARSWYHWLDDNDSMRSALIAAGYGPEPFLSCSIPNLQLDCLPIQLHSSIAINI